MLWQWTNAYPGINASQDDDDDDVRYKNANWQTKAVIDLVTFVDVWLVPNLLFLALVYGLGQSSMLDWLRQWLLSDGNTLDMR